MANNRMYLKCRVCGENSKEQMIAKYYPTTGWYLWDPETIDEFFEQHHHASQWGAGFDLSFEIEPDFPSSAPPRPADRLH
jgi:hypothetical protein